MTQLQDSLHTLSALPQDKRTQRRAVRSILSAVVAMLRNRVDYGTASEIANDTAMVILSKAADGKELTQALVYGIARNQYRKHIEFMTAGKRQCPAAADLSTEHTDQPIEYREVREAVAQLPRDTGRVIAMRYFDQRTRREITESTQLTPQNVRTLENQGLDQLRELLLA